jgi:hypothetical protein
MNKTLTAVARIVPLTALMLGACVSQSAYDQVQAQNQQLQAQNPAAAGAAHPVASRTEIR